MLTAVEPHNPPAPAQVAPRVLLATARLAARRLGHRCRAARPGGRGRRDAPSLLFSRRQAMAPYAAALLAAGRREQALDLGPAGGRRAPAEDVRSRVIAASVLAEALAACGRPAEALSCAQEAVRLAYATEQRSERAAADALHTRLTALV